MKIWANTIVCNEENFIWFAIMSVVDYVDKVLVYDTGSTDHTLEIIKEIAKIKRDKIEFRELGPVDRDEFTRLRQKMLDESNCDWILILDGDEIWWEDSIKKVRAEIEKMGDSVDGIVVPMVVPVGDIYHIQEEKAGKYKILGRTGHLSLKVLNKKIPGLHADWPYGKEGFFDIDNRLVQERNNIIFLNAPYFHVTHLKRSNSKDKKGKFKYELGEPAPKKFKFPESLYKPTSRIINSPWRTISGLDLIKSKLITPIRKIKRKFFN